MLNREEHFADHIRSLRQKHPTLGDTWWATVAEKQRLQWQVDDLREGVARLVGKFGYHAEQNPSNVRLAALVAELDALVRPKAKSEVAAVSAGSGTSGVTR